MSSSSVNTTNLLFSMYVVSGTLSIVGSGSILFLIYQDRKTRVVDKRNNYMLLGALSIFDIIVSFVLGYGWNFYPSGQHPWAQGNDNSCMAHTTFLTLGLASTYYNGSLAVYYVLIVYFAKTAVWMSKYAMPILVGLPALYAITMTIICLSLGSYGFDGKFCGWCGWVDGQQALGWAASWGPIFVSFGLVILCMTVLVYSMYLNEKKIRDRYGFKGQQAELPTVVQVTTTTTTGQPDGGQENQNNNSLSSEITSMQTSTELTLITETSTGPPGGRQNQNQNNLNGRPTSTRTRPPLKRQRTSTYTTKLKMTRKMTIQALWYIGAFFLTYAWSFVVNFMEAYGSGDVPFFVLLMRAIFQPLQGLLNFWIFYRGYKRG